MNRPLIIILSAVTLDAIGIGLIFPILPKLLAQLDGYTCERTYLAQLRATIVRNHLQELRVMLHNL